MEKKRDKKREENRGKSGDIKELKKGKIKRESKKEEVIKDEEVIANRNKRFQEAKRRRIHICR
jgi:hypothetical protein